MRKVLLACGATVALLLSTATPVMAAPLSPAQASAACAAYFGVAAGPEPLSACQWDMREIDAGAASYAKATGAGVKVGVIDGGVDFTHPDLAGAIDVGLSCSFIFDHDPTALPVEKGNGDCSNKAAVQDMQGHGTHVATTIAGRVNGVGIAGVAPGATIVALKACTVLGYCFADSVVAALRYAGDNHLDVVNLSLFADPYLFYCKNEAEQRTIFQTLSSATRYAQQRGVVVVASAGNELTDLSHPVTDELSPDWPPDAPVTRDVGNQCQVAPSELPGVVTVAATGVTTLAGYSNTGHTVNVAAPGGDAAQTPGVTFGRILAGWSSTDASPTGQPFPRLAAPSKVQRRSLGVDQWHVDGVAARGRRRRAHPSTAPEVVVRRSCRGSRAERDSDTVPDRLAGGRLPPMHRWCK